HTAAAADVARRLIDVFARPFEVAGHELTVTPSLGISIYPHDGDDLETLLRNADTAMYRAKEIGRNAFQFYSSEMNSSSLDRLLMESNLRRALAQREFVLHYQPLVNLESGLIIGVEALIRWLHPELGVILPDRFIHVAEESGLINPIGDWVLCEACRQAQAWRDEGLPPITMAVNVAPVQFRQSGFIEVVAGALATSGLAAGRLELELTERTVMHDADATMGTLSALHRMGVELSLDDFGTGYSSLAYLKRFPVGKLKIDRSFVNDLETDPDDWAIASTIVSMGRSLRMTVLAEGVEKPEQLALLRKMGCDMAQGYYFSRPVSAEGMADMLRRQPFIHE
ncbi:MAG: EAL domain-containing protein, partial [Dechloromonas sp.]|nr:EAL domain-containing protein [Dechloromonas sp.]